MENYNEKEIAEQEEKRVFFIVAILVVIFVLAGAYHVKQKERQQAQTTQTQVTQTVDNEKLWEEMIHKSAKEKKLPANWSVNAYRDARDFFKKYEHKDFRGISRKSLSDYLVYMKAYTREVADFVVFFVREDFKEQAVLYAKDEQEYPGQYSKDHPENENDLRRILTLAYFTNEEIDYAIAKMFSE